MMIRRNRILRRSAPIRSLVAETQLSASDFIAPVFLIEGKNRREPISSMPGYDRKTIDLLLKDLTHWQKMGLKSVLLFAQCPAHLKNPEATESINPNGLMQQAIRAIKRHLPDLIVMTDVALDPYSSDGHDGLVVEGEIENDSSVSLLAKMSLSHVEAGADWVAPSDMMDGRVRAIRQLLEKNHYTQVGILAYSAKYASCFYGPFRDALDSTPGFGDKKTYQMDYANVREAIKESIIDVEEGADMLMVKPALCYLDVIRAVKERVLLPVCAYQVSGEYAMIKAASEKGWVQEQAAILESTTAIKRAGADIVITYFIQELLTYLSSHQTR